MALYQSIDECQEAYIKAIGWNSSKNIDDYDEKLRRVSELIHDLIYLLRVYDPALVEVLGFYGSMSIGPDPGQITERLRAKDVDQSGYKNTKDKLEVFIISNFKMGDLM